MNLSYDKAISLAEYISSMPETLSGAIKVVLFPSVPYLFPVSGVIEEHPYIRTGAQNIYWERSGSYTGEVSVDMLPMNCEYILVWTYYIIHKKHVMYNVFKLLYIA